MSSPETEVDQDQLIGCEKVQGIHLEGQALLTAIVIRTLEGGQRQPQVASLRQDEVCHLLVRLVIDTASPGNPCRLQQRPPVARGKA